MSWQQVKAFSVSKMGTKKGWCLMNCRLGFGIPTGHFPSAKADMQAQQANGTFHSGSNVPTNVAVPVYVDTTSPYEHVMVLDHGKLYSDGRLVSGGLKGFKVFGWGECCDSVRVVKYVNNPAPTPTPKLKYKVGDKVIVNGTLHATADGAGAGATISNKHTTITRAIAGKAYPYNITGDLGWIAESAIKLENQGGGGFLPSKGYWGLGDNDARVGKLAAFMRATFPLYSPASVLGNLYGKHLQASIREFQRRTGLTADGNVGAKTYAMLKKYGFKG